MLIDVIFNSCARPALLEKSVLSTRKNIVSEKHEFRWVIVEDLVDDVERRASGKEWLTKNDKLFDEVLFSNIPAVMDKYWQKAIEVCKSDYHVHGEDDTFYLEPINIDPIIDIMIDDSNVVGTTFCRGKIRAKTVKRVINNVNVMETPFMSNSVGVFNTNNVRKVLDTVGWDSVLHETSVLSPTASKLGLKNLILGHGEQHYVHIGQDVKYRKGKYNVM